MARQRVYRHDLRCPHCGSNWLPKYGFSQGKQTYRCGDCSYHFTPGGNRVFRSEAVKAQAIAMYCEGSSLRAIGRVLEVPLLTVYGWVKKSPASPGPAAVVTVADWAERTGGGAGRDVDLCGSPMGNQAAFGLDLDGGVADAGRAASGGL